MVMDLVRERRQLRRQNHELLDRVEGLGVELASAQALFRRLFEFLPDAILVTDRDGRILMANHRAEVALGSAPQALIGRQAGSLFNLAWPRSLPERTLDLTGRLATEGYTWQAVRMVVSPIPEMPGRAMLVAFAVLAETDQGTCP